MVHSVAQLYPASWRSPASPGCRLAWVWYHRIASAAARAAPAAPFSAFGFNDQLVWGWVIGLALCPGSGPRGLAAGRRQPAPGLGGAVCRPRTGGVRRPDRRRVPAPVVAVLSLVAMLLLPFVVGGLTLLGLADTWLDFRRRLVDAGHRRTRSMIEVILREDIKSLGKAGEMVRVKPGYARNYLLPQGLAYEATEGNKKRIAAETRARAAPATRPSGPRPSGAAAHAERGHAHA